jgi:3-oxoacyl-[acyl-carrier-protein] synthase-3
MEQSEDVFIRGVGTFIPDNIYTNDELCEFYQLGDRGKRYGDLLGVTSRPVCIDYRDNRKQIYSCEEMSYRAALQALEQSEMEADQIDLIINCSSFFDYIAPTVSSRLVKRLGLDECMTLDLTGGCANFLHSIEVAVAMMRSGRARNVLITSSEVINAWYRQIRYPLEIFIFGDTGSAMVLSNDTGFARYVDGFVKTKSHSDGVPLELICMPIVGGKECPPLFYNDMKVAPEAKRQSEIPNEMRLVHNIAQITVNAARAMVDATTAVLERSKIDTAAVYLVPHQASMSVLSGLSNSGIPIERTAVSLPTRGNMSSCSVPVALSEHLATARSHQYIAMASVGVGMSYGSLLFQNV